MSQKPKSVVFSFHAKEQCIYRGCTEDEIAETIQSEPWQQAELGRLECQKDFTFNREWNGTQYGIKRVRPIFVEEQGKIIVVTVYVHYF